MALTAVENNSDQLNAKQKDIGFINNEVGQKQHFPDYT